MTMPDPAPQSFPVFESIMNGFRLIAAHGRLFMVLSFLPFAVTLLMRVAIRFLGPDMPVFWLPLLQLPSSFVIGLQGALILRFVVLAEYPIMEDSEIKARRNRAVTQSAVVFAAITYFVTGASLALFQLRGFLLANPEAAAPYTPFLMAALVLLVWAARWFWLHVPLALEWQVSGFYARIGRWQGSARVFFVFVVCSVLAQIPVDVLRSILLVLSGGKLGGFAIAFYDGIISAGSVAQYVLFSAIAAAAVKSMLRTEKGKLA